MKIAKLILLTLPVASLVGCAPPLTPQQCAAINWRQMGLNDGLGGQHRNLGRYIDQCTQYGVHVQVDQYQQGYQQGLRQYCTFDRGAAIASQGQENPGVCPDDTSFNQGYRRGADQFCQNPDRGFQLGNQGAGYPAACNPTMYPGFSNEYHRGRIIHDRASQLRETSDNIDERIDHLVRKYHLRQRGDGSYTLGTRDNPEAQNALDQVKELVKRRDHLQDKLFNTELRE